MQGTGGKAGRRRKPPPLARAGAHVLRIGGGMLNVSPLYVKTVWLLPTSVTVTKSVVASMFRARIRSSMTQFGSTTPLLPMSQEHTACSGTRSPMGTTEKSPVEAVSTLSRAHRVRGTVAG